MQKVAFVLGLALVWGVIWASVLQWVPFGRWLAQRRTWITVVVGVGVDLGIAALVLPLSAWLLVAGIIAASSLGIILRSLANEHGENKELLGAYRDQARQ